MKKIGLSMLFLAIAGSLFAQTPSAKEADHFTRLLDGSRPGSHHLRLAGIAGKWEFQDAERSYVRGTVTRSPIYDGRFFLVETMGGKLPVPVADGKMKEDNYKGLQIEGYDNIRGKFVSAAINNHIGSDIQMQFGEYDSVARAFSFFWEDELVAGEKIKNKRVLRVVDAGRYVEEYFEERGGEWVKVRELGYRKIGKKESHP